MNNIKVDFKNVKILETSVMKYKEQVEKIHNDFQEKKNNKKEFLRVD